MESELMIQMHYYTTDLRREPDGAGRDVSLGPAREGGLRAGGACMCARVQSDAASIF